jgi:polar amino acid transport system substrate-binding protein
VSFKSGEADILFPTGKNSERLKVFNYTEEPTNEANFVIYIKTESDIHWTGLGGFKGRVIGVKRGFNYGDLWNRATGIEKYSVTEISQGFEMLRANRIDGFLGYEFNWDYYLEQNKMKGQFKKLPSVGSSAEYPAALKTNSRGQIVLDAFDAGKRRLKENGKLAEIKRTWFGE